MKKTERSERKEGRANLSILQEHSQGFLDSEIRKPDFFWASRHLSAEGQALECLQLAKQQAVWLQLAMQGWLAWLLGPARPVKHLLAGQRDLGAEDAFAFTRETWGMGRSEGHSFDKGKDQKQRTESKPPSCSFA